MAGMRRLTMADISFESETHNIYDPYYTSASESEYGSSCDSVCFDSSSFTSSDSNFSSPKNSFSPEPRSLSPFRKKLT